MKFKKIGILDYGIGNVKSIYNSLVKIGAIPILINQPKHILAQDAIILPGVGAFSSGMENIHNYHLEDSIRSFINTGKPFLGICLGMQMLMGESEEFGYTKGLGLFEGPVQKLPTQDQRLPHVSWNNLLEPNPGKWNGTILHGLNENSDVYFVHTYCAVPENPTDTLALAEYGGVKFSAVIQKENVIGTQFHPEKSGKIGLNILLNFLNMSQA